MRFVLRWLGRLVLAVIVALMTAWCAGALYYSGPGGERTRTILAIAFALATVLLWYVVARVMDRRGIYVKV